MIDIMEDNDTDDYSLDDNDENFDNHENINDITNTSFQYSYEISFIIYNINHNQMEQWDLTLDPNHPDFFGNDNSTIGHYYLCQRNMLEVVKFTDILFHNPKNLEECRYYFENIIDDVIERRKQIS